ncbi:MAG: AraC family transcriptional regulator [Treponema sp.]|jgi:AraC-like DNA-binding protein/mannose-6-phosphate isomerase-like protein (cupin superfamily)|nr:AraC family transcriptional regulator [Treponema sp.]
MKKIPWQEKEEFGFSFPFRCWDSALPEFIFPSHWHEYYELVIVLDGKVQANIDGNAWEALQGDIVAINPGQLHGYPYSEKGTHLRFFQFEMGIFSKDAGIVAGEALFSRKPVLRGCGYPERDASDKALHTRACGLLTDMFNEYREQKKGYRLAVKSDLYQLALVYLRNGSPEHESLPNLFLSSMKDQASFVTEQRMERVYQLIFKNFDNIELDLEEAARTAALSPSYFAHLFKKQTGRSFYDYLSTIRVSHALEFLLKTDLPVSLIAYKCGFDSLPTFHRVFKAETGCTPAAYRKKVKESNDGGCSETGC